MRKKIHKNDDNDGGDDDDASDDDDDDDGGGSNDGEIENIEWSFFHGFKNITMSFCRLLPFE